MFFYDLINTFFLALTILIIYYYAYRLRIELERSKRLRAESERYRDLFDATSEGIAEYNRDSRCTVINTGGARLYGYENGGDVLKCKLSMRDIYYDHKELEILEATLLKQNFIKDIIMKVKHPNSEVRYLEHTFHVIPDENGEKCGIVGLFRDVTDRLAMQRELLNYSENLEKKVEERSGQLMKSERQRFNLEKLATTGQLVAQLVHELRNPLSSIKMGISTLKRRTELLEQNERILDISLREVIHLEKMMKDLLAYAKPGVLEFVECEINTILMESLEQVKAQFHDQNWDDRVELDQNIPLLQLDPDRMRQVLMNILLNAVNASEKDYRLDISTHYLKKEENVRIIIQDHGRGIGENQLKRIFEPFFSQREGGTGLGMTIVKSLVEAHGGEIFIESEIGKGTEVTIELPVR